MSAKERVKEHAKEREQGRKAKAEPGRSTAEKVSLGISLAIIIALVGLVIYAYLTRGSGPALIEVQPQLQDVRQEGGAYYLPVEVANRGDQTAEEVRVHLSLVVQGEPESAQFTIPFLAGGASDRAVVVFRQDPVQGEFITAISFLEP